MFSTNFALIILKCCFTIFRKKRSSFTLYMDTTFEKSKVRQSLRNLFSNPVLKYIKFNLVSKVRQYLIISNKKFFYIVNTYYISKIKGVTKFTNYVRLKLRTKIYQIQSSFQSPYYLIYSRYFFKILSAPVFKQEAKKTQT